MLYAHYDTQANPETQAEEPPHLVARYRIIWKYHLSFSLPSFLFLSSLRIWESRNDGI